MEKGWGCRGAQCHVYSLSLQLPGAACCAFPARRAPLISAKGSKMEVIGITLFFNYFLSDAFILALKICVCMKKKLFLLCSEIQRKLHQRCPLHKGFPPRIPRCLPAHLSFLARFSSKFCFLVAVFCLALHSGPFGGISAAPTPISTHGCLGTRGVPLPTAHRSLFRSASPLLFQCFSTILLRLEHKVPVSLLLCPHSCDESYGVTLTQSPQSSRPHTAPSLCRCAPRHSAQCWVLGGTEAAPFHPRVLGCGVPLCPTPRGLLLHCHNSCSPLYARRPTGVGRGDPRAAQAMRGGGMSSSSQLCMQTSPLPQPQFLVSR